MQRKSTLIFLLSVLLFTQSFHFQSPSITLNFGGDCTFSDHYSLNIKLNDIHKTFENIPWFSQADITMVNLESCISSRGNKLEKEFNFRMHPKYLPVLKYGGIDIVNLANNHIVDYGLTGMKDTFYYLDSMNIKYVGAGLNLEQARKPAIFNIRGIKIGFLGYSFAFAANKNSWGTVPIDTNIIKEDLHNLKQKVDFIVVNFHWGKERSNYASTEQQRIGRFTIDNGANVVIGHHPHVLQAVEQYKGGYIAYSLGNFIFGGNSRKQHHTALAKVTIHNKRVQFEVIPIEVRNFCAFELQPQKKDSIINLINHYSMQLSK